MNRISISGFRVFLGILLNLCTWWIFLLCIHVYKVQSSKITWYRNGLVSKFLAKNIFDFFIQGRFGAIIVCFCLSDFARWSVWGAYMCGSTSVGRQVHTTQGVWTALVHKWHPSLMYGSQTFQSKQWLHPGKYSVVSTHRLNYILPQGSQLSLGIGWW